MPTISPSARTTSPRVRPSPSAAPLTIPATTTATALSRRRTVRRPNITWTCRRGSPVPRPSLCLRRTAASTLRARMSKRQLIRPAWPHLWVQKSLIHAIDSAAEQPSDWLCILAECTATPRVRRISESHQALSARISATTCFRGSRLATGSSASIPARTSQVCYPSGSSIPA